MTQDEIIEMASKVYGTKDFHESALFHLEAFAKLVEAKERDRMCEQCKWSKHENATCNEANRPKVLGES